jgi:S1-C subfamily serine protease
MHTEAIGTDGFVIEYFDRPSVTSVDPESPAQRAGIEPGDVLMAYNGSDVLGNRFDLTDLLVPEKKISVTVKRDGDTKVYEMTVAKVPQGVTLRRRDLGTTTAVGDVYFMKGDDEMPRVPIAALPRGNVAGSMILSKGLLITPNGALGAVMSTVSPELAKMLKLETGVLVNDITDDTPAAKAGLHPGDVIVNVAGQPVASLRSLQEQILRHAESSIVLQVIRDKKLRKITVSW